MNAPAISAMTIEMIGVPVAAPSNWATSVALARCAVHNRTCVRVLSELLPITHHHHSSLISPRKAAIAAALFKPAIAAVGEIALGQRSVQLM